MDVQQLVRAAMAASGETTLRPFAARLGVTHGAVAHWLADRADPTFEQAMELAELAGLDPVTTAAEVRATTRGGARYRRLLQKLARGSGRAAGLVAALGGAVLTSWSVGILPIMSGRRTGSCDAARLLQGSGHDRKTPLLA